MGDWMEFCLDCGVAPRVPHKRGCPEEQCPYCGKPLAGCGCLARLGLAEVPEALRVPWDPHLFWRSAVPSARRDIPDAEPYHWRKGPTDDIRDADEPVEPDEFSEPPPGCEPEEPCDPDETGQPPGGERSEPGQ